MPEFQDTQEFRAAREAWVHAAPLARKTLRSILDAAGGRELTNSQRADAVAAVAKAREAAEDLAKHGPAENAKGLKDYVDKSVALYNKESGTDAAWVKAQLEALGPEPEPQLEMPPIFPTAGGSGKADGDKWVDKHGHEVKVLRPDQRLKDLLPRPPGREPELSIGKYLRGIVSGNWRGAQAEMKAMSEGVLGAGGYLVPAPLAADVIDRARNLAQVMRAGAQTIPMDSQTMSIARVTGDPTAAWHAEAGAISATDMTFDRVVLTAQTLAALCQLSVELAEDAPNIDQVVSDTLGRVLAIELDRAALRGSGTAPEPRGVRNQTGVTIDSATFGANGSVISNAAPTGAVAWIWLAKTIAGRWTANEFPNGAIFAPRTAGELDQLVDTTGQPLRPPPSCDAVQKLQTASIPVNLTQGTSVDCSECYVGDFNKLLIGVRTELRLEVSRLATVGATSMFSTMQVAIRAYLRADVQLARPAAFAVVTGIR